MVIIAVPPRCMDVKSKGKEVKDAEFGTTGKKRQGTAAHLSAW
jgi:hypothetical protein